MTHPDSNDLSPMTLRELRRLRPHIKDLSAFDRLPIANSGAAADALLALIGAGYDDVDDVAMCAGDLLGSLMSLAAALDEDYGQWHRAGLRYYVASAPRRIPLCDEPY